MKTLIAIPCLDSMPTLFVSSLLALKRPPDSDIAISASSLVYDSRNNLAQKAVNEGYDRILWLDSDMYFSDDLHDRLSARLDEGAEYVSALYFTRKNPIIPVAYEKCGVLNNEPHIVPLNLLASLEPMQEVEATGFGACMITVGLLRKMAQFGMPFSPIIGFGEDFSFCLRARETGAKLYCDTTIKVGHIGQSIVTEDTWRGSIK